MIAQAILEADNAVNYRESECTKQGTKPLLAGDRTLQAEAEAMTL